MTLFKTLIFTILVPGTVTVLIPRWLLSTEHTTPTGAIHYLGLVPILMGAAIYLWCAWDFATFGKGTPAPIDAPKKLVVRGLYRVTRNPMYIGVGLILIGERQCCSLRSRCWLTSLSSRCSFNFSLRFTKNRR